MSKFLQDVLKEFDQDFDLNSEDIDSFHQIPVKQDKYESSNQDQAAYSPHVTKISTETNSLLQQNRERLSPQNTTNQSTIKQPSVYSVDNSTQIKSNIRPDNPHVSPLKVSNNFISPGCSLPTTKKSAEIAQIYKTRIQDATKLKELQIENARLTARLTILQHIDVNVVELGSKVEQLLQLYLDSEQIRSQQQQEISLLRQRIVILKKRFGSK